MDCLAVHLPASLGVGLARLDSTEQRRVRRQRSGPHGSSVIPATDFRFSSGGHTYYTGSGYVAKAIADTAPIISGYIDAFVNKMSSDHDPDVSDLYPMRVWTDAENWRHSGRGIFSLTAMFADIRASTEDNVGTQTVAAFCKRQRSRH